MAHYFPDFVVVIHPGDAYPDAILNALRVNKAIALDVMTYIEWLSREPAVEHNLLCILENGELLYAQNAAEKAAIRSKIISLF